MRTRDFVKFEPNPHNPIFRPSSNPQAWDSSGLLTPQVFVMNSTYYMIYAGLKGTGWNRVSEVQSGLAVARRKSHWSCIIGSVSSRYSSTLLYPAPSRAVSSESIRTRPLQCALPERSAILCSRKPVICDFIRSLGQRAQARILITSPLPSCESVS